MLRVILEVLAQYLIALTYIILFILVLAFPTRPDGDSNLLHMIAETVGIYGMAFLFIPIFAVAETSSIGPRYVVEKIVGPVTDLTKKILRSVSRWLVRFAALYIFVLSAVISAVSGGASADIVMDRIYDMAIPLYFLILVFVPTYHLVVSVRLDNR